MGRAKILGNGFRDLQKAWSFPTLRPLIEKEVGFLGNRINAQLRKQELYRRSLRRGRLEATVVVGAGGGVIPRGVRMDADGELLRPRGSPLHLVRTSSDGGARKPPPGLVKIRYVRAGRRGGRRGLADRKSIAGLYQPAKLRERDLRRSVARRGGTGGTGRGSLAGLGADWILAYRISHSPKLWQHRVNRQLRKQASTLERRMGFLLRRRGIA